MKAAQNNEAGKAAMVNLPELKSKPPIREQLAAEAGVSGRRKAAPPGPALKLRNWLN